jgi:hypothetical protein
MRRSGVALVAVLALTVLLIGLGTTLLTTSGQGRVLQSQAEGFLRRELALDAAVVHAFHELKGLRVRSREDLAALAGREGGGELGGVTYRYRLVPDPTSGTVRIEAESGTGEDPTLEGEAVAAVRHRVDARHVAQRSQSQGSSRSPGHRRMRQRWSLEYLGRPTSDP